ncbi:MAG: hypothetical protein HYY24_27720 [Verrucomicrobia bacterium]|nr:hypothetical protein [Verrucomicrobiota bacterium]
MGFALLLLLFPVSSLRAATYEQDWAFFTAGLQDSAGPSYRQRITFGHFRSGRLLGGPYPAVTGVQAIQAPGAGTPADPDAPVISPIADQIIPEDGNTGPIPFTLADADTPLFRLELTRQSSNLGLVPLAGIQLAGAGANRGVRVVPLPDAFGSAVITITVSDGTHETVETFEVLVNPVNDPPTLTSLPSETVLEDTPTGELHFQVADVETPVEQLIVTADAEDTVLVPPGNITVGGTGADRWIQITPAPDQFGSTRVTYRVSDGEATTENSFLFTVLAQDDPPTPSPCFECTHIIGYSQVGLETGWFVKDGIFEALVGSERWQLVWQSGATLEMWQNPDFGGWDNTVVSPCASNAATPDRVLLNLAGNYGSDEPAWVEAINATIDVIMDKFPSVRRILLQPVVGGPDHALCEVGGDTVRASESHPYMDNAIATVVAARTGTQPEVHAGFSPEVRTCADYVDSTGHFTAEGAAAAAQAIGDYYATLDAGCVAVAGPQDWGDAPLFYSTTLARNGARHTIVPGLTLGLRVDPEPNGQPNPNADGDDTNSLDDEDGVLVLTPVVVGAGVQLAVGAPGGGKLDAWMDFNRDGDFADTDEKIFNARALTSGANLLTFLVPSTASPGVTFTRFRLSTAGGLNFDGPATDGEVEDYRLTLLAPSPASLVRAHHADGQVWVVWQYDPAAPPQNYAIYRSPSSFADVSSATLVGRLFSPEWEASEVKGQIQKAFGTAPPTGFVIPNGSGGTTTLLANEGLFVDTVRTADNGVSYFYAVVPWGQTTVAATEFTATSVMMTYDVTDPPECHLQATGLNQGPGTTDFPVSYYVFWADGDLDENAGRADFPIMGNASKRGAPHIFMVVEPPGGLAGQSNVPATLAFHGADADASLWLPSGDPGPSINHFPTDGYLIAPDTKTWILLNHLPFHHNTRWFGYVRGFDPFENLEVLVLDEAADTNVPAEFNPPADETIINYTQRQLVWALDWFIAHKSIDRNRVSLFGHSAGSVGANHFARTFPDRFSTVSLFNNGQRYWEGLPHVVQQGDSTLNLPTNLLKPDGQPVRLLDLFPMTTRLAAARDLPLFRVYHGKCDDNGAMHWGADMLEVMRDADEAGLGGHFYWDLRKHGMDQWKDYWVDASTLATLVLQTQRDDVRKLSRYRADQSFPAFFNFQDYPDHGDPGPGWTGGSSAAGPCGQAVDDLGNPVPNGDDHGTWGGYYDWNQNTLEDTATAWQATLFLVNSSSGLAAVDVSPYSQLTSDVAIRRPQAFKPVMGTLLDWTVTDLTTGLVLQSGTTTVAADDLVTVPGIIVYRDKEVRLCIATPGGCTPPVADFGDAPGIYPVTRVQNGAQHTQLNTLFLGAAVDVENNGQPSLGADGDDTNSTDDEDGVLPTSAFVPGQNATINVTASGAGFLDAWFDFNADGDWTDAGEQIFTSQPVVSGLNALAFPVPATAAVGRTFARFRLSSGGGLAPTGSVVNGEVEDYAARIISTPPPALASGLQAAPSGGANLRVLPDGGLELSELSRSGEDGVMLLAPPDLVSRNAGRILLPLNPPVPLSAFTSVTQPHVDGFLLAARYAGTDGAFWNPRLRFQGGDASRPVIVGAYYCSSDSWIGTVRDVGQVRVCGFGSQGYVGSVFAACGVVGSFSGDARIVRLGWAGSPASALVILDREATFTGLDGRMLSGDRFRFLALDQNGAPYSPRELTLGGLGIFMANPGDGLLGFSALTVRNPKPPRLLELSVEPGGRAQVNFDGEADVFYRLEYQDALGAGPWRAPNLLYNFSAGGAETLGDTAEGVSMRFYRVVAE